jgi:hypothetical protein
MMHGQKTIKFDLAVFLYVVYLILVLERKNGKKKICYFVGMSGTKYQNNGDVISDIGVILELVHDYCASTGTQTLTVGKDEVTCK